MAKTPPSPSLETPLAPLRFGVAGLTRDGIFHIESLALRREFTPVAAAGIERRIADGIGGCRQVSPEELLETELDLAFIATSTSLRAKTAFAFLSRGTNVLIEAGFDVCQRDSLETCLELAAGQGLFCGIWQPELSDPDYLAAKSVSTSAESGAVRSARFIQHGLAPGLHSQAATGKFDDDSATENALVVARRRLSQLQQFVEAPATAIRLAARNNDGEMPTAATIHVEFDNGATGLIDIDIAAATSLHSGWILQATNGGYGNGQQSIVESDGEVYEVPIEIEPVDPYSELTRVLQSSAAERLEISRQSVEAEIQLATLIADAQQD